MSNIFLIMFAAILAENFIFSRLYGVEPFIGASDKPRTALGMGAVVTVVMTLSSAATYAVYYLFLERFGLEYLKTVAFVLVIVAASGITELLFEKLIPSVYSSIADHFTFITTNCAVLGALLLNVQAHNSFADSILFGLASALGFTLASVVFAGVRARMTFSDPPKAFKGAPILLIAAGLIAMAFSGFSGMKFS